MIGKVGEVLTKEEWVGRIRESLQTKFPNAEFQNVTSRDSCPQVKLKQCSRSKCLHVHVWYNDTRDGAPGYTAYVSYETSVGAFSATGTSFDDAATALGSAIFGLNEAVHRHHARFAQDMRAVFTPLS